MPPLPYRLGIAAVCLLLALTARAQEQKPDPSSDRLNILLIIGDDLTYTDIGVFGNPDVRTPNLDRLAGEGVRLTGLFTTAPMCAPTRMSIYTGQYPVRNGGHPNHSAVYDDVRSLPNYLKPLGYRVALLGKKHYRPEKNFPFQYLGGRNHDGGKGLDLDINLMTGFIEADDDPFCIVLASNQPHAPWNRGDASRYDADALTLPPYLVDTPETREELTHYYAEVEYLDGQVGQALKILEDTGHADDTVVLFVSEQGASFPHGKWTLYDVGIRAAGILRMPGITEAGSTRDALLSYVDILPTFVDLAGGEPAGLDVDGRSFLPMFEGNEYEPRDAVFAVQTSRGIIAGPQHFGIRAVRTDQFKYIRNLNPRSTFQNVVTKNAKLFESWKAAADAGNAFAAERVHAYQHRPAEELYDVDADPFELHNLADDPAYAETMTDLRKRLDAWMAEQGDEGKATEMDALNRQPKHQQ